MRQQSSERGFVLAAVLFFITALGVTLAVVIPSYIMQSRRDMEDELIFRGAEYARAIRKFQIKYGYLPLTIDELMMGSDGVPSLRKRYVDPTTGEEFRLIYLNPDGTLNGSNVYLTLRDARTNTAQTQAEVAEALSDEVAANGGATGGTGGTGGTGNPGINTGINNQGVGLNNQGTGLNNQGTGLNNQGTGLNNQGVGLNNQGTQLNPAARGGTTTPAAPTTNTGTGTGGTTTQQTGLVGVGSQTDRIAVKKYVNQDRYVNWEFIANVNRNGRGNTGGTNTTGTTGTTGTGGGATGGGATGGATGGGTLGGGATGGGTLGGTTGGTTGGATRGTTGGGGATGGGGGGGARGGN
jgi:hypothetical protein